MVRLEGPSSARSDGESTQGLHRSGSQAELMLTLAGGTLLLILLPFPSAPCGSELHRALLAASGIEHLILKRAQQTEKQVPSNTKPQAHIAMRRGVESRACLSFVMEEQSTAPTSALPLSSKESFRAVVVIPPPQTPARDLPNPLGPRLCPLHPSSPACCDWTGEVQADKETSSPASSPQAQLPAQCTMRNALASSDAISSHPPPHWQVC